MSQDRNRPAGSIAITVQGLTAGNTVVHLDGDLIGEATAAVEQAIIDELSRAPEQLIVDLSAITRIDAGGVAVLAAAAAVGGASGRGFCLVAGKDCPVQAALAAEPMSRLFKIFSSVSEAVQESR